MKTTKNAFTLTELLVAIVVIGAIAAMSIPSIMNNINRRLMVTQLKNTYAQVKQLVDDQRIMYNTKDLSQTDFANPAVLITKFDTAKPCGENECWAESYRTIASVQNENISPQNSVKLKNGASLAYELQSTAGPTYAYVTIDLNGKAKPNVIGRDLFVIYISKNGTLGQIFQTGSSMPIGCMSGDSSKCLNALMENNWDPNTY